MPSVILTSSYRNPNYFNDNNQSSGYVYSGGGSVPSGSYYTKIQLDGGALDSRYYTETELNNGQLDGRYYTKALLDGGQLDGRYYREAELDGGALDTRYYTKTQLDGGQLDGRYYTETEIDSFTVKLTGNQTIDGLKTFVKKVTVNHSTNSDLAAYIRNTNAGGFGAVIQGGGVNNHVLSLEDYATNEIVNINATRAKFNNLIQGNNLSSVATYSSGFGGAGYAISEDSGKYSATFDNLTVRGTMNVYELMIQQIRASNGSIWISDSIKYEVDYGTDTTYWKIGIDTENGSRAHSMQSGDIIKCQKWTGSGIKSTILTVSSVDGAGSYIFCSKATQIGADPAIGDEFVRIGSTSNASRRGALYLTASDSDNPYLDVINGLSTAGGAFTTLARLGRLDGITDTAAGLDGTQSNYYGLYTSNGHFKGHIYATSGNIGGWILDSDSIKDSAGLVGMSSAATASDDVRFWAGDTSLTLAPFRVTEAGNLYATKGEIGGWSLDTNAIYTGTKQTANGYSSSGITYAADGSIHARTFYINSNGDVGIKTSTSTSSYFSMYGDTIQMYYDNALSFEVKTSSDSGKTGSYYGGSYVFTMTKVANLGIRGTYLSGTGIRTAGGLVGGSLGASREVLKWDGTDLQIGDDDGYTDTVVKGPTIFTHNMEIRNPIYMIDTYHGAVGSPFSDATVNINCNRSGYAMRIYNDGNYESRSGIYMKIGKDVPGTPDNNYIYAVDGDGTLVGTLLNDSTAGFRIYNASDSILKTEIRDLEESAVEKISRVKARRFQWVKSKEAKLKVPDAIGFIAQELKKEFPEAVKIDKESGLHMISEAALIPHLYKAIQELQEQINTLNNRLN